ncbi:MAG: DUF2207 domain-containing protein [Balneolaceae bacterium]|nr:DUF2207 domain-containing protein [Balneolaceae bacterium]
MRISGPGGPFVHENSERPGTFLVRRSDDMIDFRWFFEAEDERRTFTISYTLEEAVVVGPRWSEFFWTWLGDDRPKSNDSLSVRLDLPRAVPADSLHPWTRGVRDRITASAHDGGFELTARSIDDHESVRLRAVFPTSVFRRDSVSVNDAAFSLASARQDEQGYRERREEQEAYNAWLAGIGRKLAVLTAVLSIGAFVYFYRRWGSRHPVSGTGSDRASLVPPSREKPALVGWLLGNRTTTGGHLMATLLDLARRGYFNLRERSPEKEGWLTQEKPVFTIASTDKEPEADLLPWEADMLELRALQARRGGNRAQRALQAAFQRLLRLVQRLEEADQIARL